MGHHNRFISHLEFRYTGWRHDNGSRSLQFSCTRWRLLRGLPGAARLPLAASAVGAIAVSAAVSTPALAPAALTLAPSTVAVAPGQLEDGRMGSDPQRVPRWHAGPYI